MPESVTHVRFYISVFGNSKALRIVHYGDVGPGPKGTVMTANFLIEDQEFVALNGGPAFTFSQAISFVVNCNTQEEIDRFWEQLSEGGEKQQCGWLKDKFGVSWQVYLSFWPGCWAMPIRKNPGVS